MTKIQHKRSSVLVSGAAKAPTSAQLDYGELAINYSSTDPQLFIKDSSGSVISILSSYAPLDGATFTGDVNFDAEAIIRGDSTNSGALTLNSETNSKYVKIQAPANSSLTSYTLTLPNDDGGIGEVLSTDGSGGLSWAYAAMSTADKTKLDGIAAGAEVNVNADWTASSGDAQILNKPTNVSAFTNDAGYITSPNGGNAQTLDSLDSSQFLRSDTSDTFTGTLSITGSINNSSTGGSSGAILGNLQVGYGAAYNSISAQSNNALHLNYNSTGPVYVGSSNTVWHAGNDGSGSGLDADLLDGVQGSSYLRSDASDTFTGTLTCTGGVAVNGGTGNNVSGHDATLYVSASNGSDWGIIVDKPSADYGLDVRMGVNNSYGIRVLSNSTEQFRVGTDYAYHYSDMRSPIFYASDNTSYYLDPNSGSNLYNVTVNELYNHNWFRNYNSGEGLYNQATGAYWYSDGDGIWNLTGNTQDQGTSLKFRGTYNGNIEGWIHANGSGWFGFLNAAGQWALKQYNVDGYSPNLWFDEESNETWTGNPGSDEGKIEYHSNRFYIAAGSNSTEVLRLRRSGGDVAYYDNSGNSFAPRFYDYNNTSYYLDPANWSTLHRGEFYGYNGSVSTGNAVSLEIQNGGGTGDGGVAAMSFHCGGYYAMHMHLRHDSYFGIGGWSASTWRWYVQMSTGNMTAAGNVTAYSDIRLKEEIAPLHGCLDKLLGLNGVSFRWKDLPDVVGHPGQKDFGIIAQEVEKVFPEVIHESAHESPDGDKYKTVAYDKLVPVLIEAIKELSVRLTVLENKS